MSVLQMDGHRVTGSGRGDEALELVRRRQFDLVLVDLYMTPITGMDILQAAIEAHKEVAHLRMEREQEEAAA